MKAETLNCPMCGAAAATDATHCLYCSSRLATVSCPQCFGMMYRGSRHCPRCGASGARRTTVETTGDCPRCVVRLEKVVLGESQLRECQRCDGLWVDILSFEQICADREHQSRVLGAAHFASARETVKGEARVRYVPCPECGQLMNRVNFARCSGVVVDVCKGHGTWFDRDELAEIIEFIRAGGLDQARDREKAELEETRRRLRAEQLAAARQGRGNPLLMNDDERRFGLAAAARELLRLLKNKE
jgi:Zn-finger nucleic acid-binding protein